MEFHEYMDLYRLYCQGVKKNDKKYKRHTKLLSILDYYKYAYESGLVKKFNNYTSCYNFEDTAARLFITSELLWHDFQKPYYRIYPDYVDIFSKTNLDIPVKYMKSPYQVFSIRFAKGYEPLINDMKAVTILVSLYNPYQIGLEHGQDLSDMPDVEKKRYLFTIRISGLKDDEELGLFDTTLTMTWFDIPEYDDLTIEGLLTNKKTEALTLFWKTNFPDMLFEVSPREITHLNRFLRIALSVCFLATGMDRIIEADVLNKDFYAYLEAVNKHDDLNINHLHDKATKIRGSVGYTIGRQEQLLGRRTLPRLSDASEGDTSLTYQHQRRGHIHKYWIGNNRDTFILRWIDQLTVRPDLPIDPRAIGGRTLVSKGEEQQRLGG